MRDQTTAAAATRTSPALVTLDDVDAAARRIAGRVLRTPLLTVQNGLWLKPESLQPTGAFKLRGATNAVLQLSDAQRQRGVLTHSSGNHGQALAYAASLAGVACTVVMPHGAAAVKVASTRRYGAHVDLVEEADRIARVEELAAASGAEVVPPYDDARIIAGQGTVGREIVDDLPDVGTVLVPSGGGGLVSGVAVAVKALSPSVRVVAVEPELAGDLADGFARGEHAVWSPALTTRTIAGGLHSSTVGALNWAHVQAFVDDVVTVTEEEIVAAVRFLATTGRLVAEPSGAVATAHWLRDPGAYGPAPVAAVVSGGNVDEDLLRRLLG
jgi:threonine dehydratase